LTTQDPVPDLPGAIFAALGALSPLDASLAQVGADLRDELDKPANAAFDRALRQQVVVGTLQALANSIDQLDPTGQWCDLTRFRTAIELDIES
jgi:hypothetical protein